MGVKIAHASISEKGTITGTAGDQTGKEVCIRGWYNRSEGWLLIRCKDPAMRPYIAEAAEAAAKNDHIGYDQYQNGTLYNQVKDKGFDPAKATVDTETDCSRLVRVCVQYACEKVGNGKTIPEFYTATEPTILKNTGLFDVLTDSKYTKQDDFLLRGDILCTKTKGHTVVVISNGSKAGSETESGSAGTGTAPTAARLTVDGRWGSGTTKRLQQIFGTPADGVVSNQVKAFKDDNPGLMSGWEWEDKPNGKGSALIKAMQKWAGMAAAAQDGEIGPNTIKALQRKLGTSVDGKVSNPSQMVRALQKWANEQ